MLSDTPITADVRIQRQAETLVAAGLEVHVWRTIEAGPTGRPPRSPEARNGVFYHHHPSGWYRFMLFRRLIRKLVRHPFITPQRQWRVWLFPDWESRLVSDVQKSRPKHVHSFDIKTLALGARLADATGAQLFADLYEAPIQLSEATSVKLAQKRGQQESDLNSHLRRVTHLFTVSTPLKDHYRLLEPRLPATILFNSPRTNNSEPSDGHGDIREDTGLSESTPLVCYVGLVAPGRGVDVLLRFLQHDLRDCHMALVGPGGIAGKSKYLHSILSEFPRATRDRIHVLPFQPSDHLSRYLSTADVGVFLPDDSTLNHRVTGPNKFFEMLLAGIPMVVSDLGLMGDIVRKEKRGHAVPPGDSAAAISAVLDILANRGAPLASDELERLRATYGWAAQEPHLLTAYGLA